MEDRPQRATASPEVQQRVRASFDRQGLMKHLGAELAAIEQGCVTTILRARPEVSQQHGYVHAGATSSIADGAGGYAALTMFPSDAEVLTVEYKLNLLSPAGCDWLEAVGTVVKAGRTLTVCTLEVFGVEGGERKLVAMGQQTLFCVRQEPN